MPRVIFAPSLQRHVDCAALDVTGATVAEVLERALEQQPKLRGYVLDDQGRLRRHVAVFVDARQVRDRAALSDPTLDDSEVYVVQALSGG
jgi:sulfur-carrier protein